MVMLNHSASYRVAIAPATGQADPGKYASSAEAGYLYDSEFKLAYCSFSATLR